jgi:hypothetical protein
MGMTISPSLFLPLAFLSLFSITGLAQDRPPLSLNFEQAVELALKSYPAIRAAQSQRQSAEAGVELARANYLPRADMLWQQNRATRNNVFGLLLPQSVIPGISGPQLDSTSMSSAWGSAGGLMLSWEPFDFGLRKSNLELTRAISRQADANEAVTRLDVSAAAADAFLTLRRPTSNALKRSPEPFARWYKINCGLASSAHSRRRILLQPRVAALRRDAGACDAATLGGFRRVSADGGFGHLPGRASSG